MAGAFRCGDELWVPQNAGNFLTSWRPVSLSGRPLFHAIRSVGNHLLHHMLS